MKVKNLSFLEKLTGPAIVKASTLAPKFMAQRLVPRLLTPRRRRSHLADTSVDGWNEFGSHGGVFIKFYTITL